MAAEELCVSVSGVLTRLTPILNEDGDRVRQGNGYAYMTAGGAVMTVMFQNEQRQTGTPSAAAACSVPAPDTAATAACSVPAPDTTPATACSTVQQAAADTQRDVRDDSSEDSSELWTKKALWQALAEAVSKEFSCTITAVQAENKWKSLERAYKKTKTKNNSSGHSRVSCCHEEELSEVLEREHHISPTFLLAPGRVIENDSSTTPSDTEATSNNEAETSQEEANHNEKDPPT
ncbi:hypothetical protein MTO96_043854 [Rhipicephalus appendiculatus]